MGCLRVTAWCSTLALSLPICNAVVTEVLMRRASSPQASELSTLHVSRSLREDTDRGGSGHPSAAQGKLLEEDDKLVPLVIESAPFRTEVLAGASNRGLDQHFQAEKRNASFRKIQWAQHPDKCLTKNATTGEGALALVIWDCSDEMKAELMKWILPPASDLGVGSIKWGGNMGANQCISSDKGWSGNGNTISLGSCSNVTASNKGAMNWSLFNPKGTGLNAISYTEDSTKCLDVHEGIVENGVSVEMWDCSSGTKWIMVDL
mmetsp:Transcript_12266/g.21313  ORF Transcript_12266/g.21313 Transcript_12266/m.21313 type:complete len:262 (+) Transcript_12266:123-908(+)